MASLKSSSALTEAGTGFSYAQAAKGRSPSAPSTKVNSAGPSGSATPSSVSMASESTPASSYADESDAKASVTSAQSQDTSSLSRQQRRIDSSTSSAPQSLSGGDKPIKNGNNDASASQNDSLIEDSKSTDSDKDVPAPSPKPVLQEARQPAVNIWQQRAAEAKAKARPIPLTARSAPATAAPSVAGGSPDRAPVDSRRRSEQNGSNSVRPKNDAPRHEPRSNGVPSSFAFPGLGSQRRSLPHSAGNATNTAGSLPARERDSADALPNMTGELSWPKPTDLPIEEKRRGSDKDDRKDVQGQEPGVKPHGKTEWKVMPYTPSAVFETPVYGKGSSRVGAGAGGAPRGAGARAGQANPNRSSTRAASVPVEETISVGSKTREDAETQRQRMPPPSAPTTERLSDHTTHDNTKSADDVARQSNIPKRHQSLKKIDAVRKNDEHSGRQSLATSAASERLPATAAVDGRDHRRPYPTRPVEDAGREPRKSGKSKSNRNSIANGTFTPASPFQNGHDFGGFGNAPAFVPQRGTVNGSGAGRGGAPYRGVTRSQSIPLDNYGRPGQYSGYPTGQQFVPEFYGGYPVMPVSMAPGTERDLLFGAVATQLEYYFSMDNLLKDLFLRKHMDGQGWIFLGFVADFNRLKQMTTDYELLKSICLHSPTIEIKVGDDSRDRVRKAEGWEQFVLPVGERDSTVQHDGPATLRRPSVAHVEQPAFLSQSPSPDTTVNGQHESHDHGFHPVNGGHFHPTVLDPRFADFQPSGESRGRQINHSHHSNAAPYAAAAPFVPASDQGEPDKFSTSQIEELVVVVRKHHVNGGQKSHTSARTFSDGSIDPSNIVEEVERMNGFESAVTVPNGFGTGTTKEPSPSVALYWVKDKSSPIDSLPEDTTHEHYTHLRAKALDQREAAATGTCPYDLAVLYQFWSHFLIRNYNSSMYSEFRHLARLDAAERHSDVGLKNLAKYYVETMCSQVPVRDNVATDYVELLSSEASGTERPGYTLLSSSWRNGDLNIKNRKKLNDRLSESMRASLDA